MKLDPKIPLPDSGSLIPFAEDFIDGRSAYDRPIVELGPQYLKHPGRQGMHIMIRMLTCFRHQATASTLTGHMPTM